MQKKISYSLVTSFLLATTNLFSVENLEPITVSSSLISTNEKNATYATEIYTQEDIKKSKSKDIYEFLSSQTSVNVKSYFGNSFSQLLDMRGYGIANGGENLVVLINGRRLNNVDSSPQLLSSIPVDSIEKIEILKGTGSVQYGDGANSGVINIITTGKNENYVKTYVGSNGTKNGTLSFGQSFDKAIINGYTDYNSTDGSISNSLNEKDENYNKNKKIGITYFPTDNLELNLSRSYSNMDTNYANPISLLDYQNNINKTSGFTEQYFRSYVTSTGAKYNINNNLSFDVDYNDENKLSRYSSGYASNYNYKSYSTKLNYVKNDFKTIVGIDGFNGDRLGSDNITTKDNKAAFISAEYNINDKLKVSSGARKENLEYEYNNNSTSLNKDIDLNAYDAGINYQLNDVSSVFANFNKSYQAPDIDKFFSMDWSTGATSFNGFINPAKVNNYTVGYNNILKTNKLKISLFEADLKDEIYYYKTGAWSGYNTNIDKSHKYGFEFFDKYIVNDNLFTSVNYSYIIAKIDEENEANGAYNGKDLPGVSKHNITLNLGYEINDVTTILSHTFRSSTYASDDLKNNFAQKQDAYNSTDLTTSYNYQNLELFAKIQNIFAEKNGLWIEDNSIYPINFERTYFTGMKAKF